MVDTRTRVPYWDDAERAVIARPYKRAIGVEDTAVNVPTVPGIVATADDLFEEWLGDMGNNADTAGWFATDAWWGKYGLSPFARGMWGKNIERKQAPRFGMI